MGLWYDNGSGWSNLDLHRANLGADIFICCPGPSLAKVNPADLQGPGIYTLALNTTYPYIKPSLWLGMDEPECYDRRVWWEPFWKVARGGYQNRFCCGQPIKWAPMTAFADVDNGGLKDIFAPPRPTTKFLWCKDALTVALHLAVWLGGKAIYLVGSDFGGNADYHDGRTISVPEQEENRALYRQQVDRVADIAKLGEQHGVRIMSATEGSAINGKIEYVPLDKALAGARAHAPAVGGKPVHVGDLDQAPTAEKWPKTGKPRMLHINRWIDIGGAEFYILSLIKALPQYEHHVRVLFNSIAQEMALQFRVNAGVVLCGPMDKPLDQIAREIDPAVIVLHSFDEKDTKLSQQLRRVAPTVRVWHGCWSDMDGQYAANVAVSSMATERIKTGPKPFLCRGAIDLSQYPPNRQDDVPVVVARWGSDRPDKRSPDNAEILEGVRRAGANILVVGSAGDYRPLAQQPGVECVPASTWRKAAYLSRMHVALCRNRQNCVEGFSMAVMEAMASGVVVVAEARGGMLEQIADGVDGFLVPWEDRAAFIDRMTRLTQNVALRTDMAARARAHAGREFGLERMARDWQPVLEAVKAWSEL